MSIGAKEILFAEDARQRLLDGIDQVAEVVGKTYGPKGRSVAIDASPVMITSDGASVVKKIELKDEFADMGVYFAKQVAANMKEKCGDGTTTAIILFSHLVKEGIKLVSSGANPLFIKNGMEKALKSLLKQIDDLSVQVTEDYQLENIATISAANDKEAGQLISEAFKRVGKNSQILIEKSNRTTSHLELLEGLQHPRGFMSPYFCTNAEKLHVEMENAKILITDKKIAAIQDILPILQATAASGDSLVIIADDIDADVLATLVVNKLKNLLKVVAIKAPGYGERRKDYLEDLAIFTGASVVSEEKGLLLKDADISVLGQVEKILITKDKTTFLKGKANPQELANRIELISAQIEKEKNSYEKEKLQERKAQLEGKVGVIQIGALSELDMEKKKQHFEDSYNATRCALLEGVVAGGGVSYLQAMKRAKEELFPLTHLENPSILEAEEKMGAELVFSACLAPLRQLLMNAYIEPSLIIQKIEQAECPIVFNLCSQSFEDFQNSQVMDPTLLVKQALIFSVSQASVVLLTEALVSEKQK